MSAVKATCKNCGREFDFDASMKTARCPSCQSEVICPAVGETVEMLSVRCGGCGAQVEFSPELGAVRCAYCGATHQVQSEGARITVAAPENIIPFSVGSKKMQHELRNWYVKGFFTPLDLIRQAHLEDFVGIYLPYYSYQCRVQGNWRGTRVDVHYSGKHMYETRMPCSGTLDYYLTHDELYCMSSVNRELQESGKFDKADVFAISQSQPFRKEYLLGFSCENFNYSQQEAWEKFGKPMADKLIEARIAREIGGTRQEGIVFNGTIDPLDWKAHFLPMWLTTYTYEGAKYHAYVNGATAAVFGDKKVSGVKLGVTIALGVIAIICFFTGILIFISVLAVLAFGVWWVVDTIMRDGIRKEYAGVSTTFGFRDAEPEKIPAAAGDTKQGNAYQSASAAAPPDTSSPSPFRKPSDAK